MSRKTVTLNRPADSLTWESIQRPAQFIDQLNDLGISIPIYASDCPGGKYMYHVRIDDLTQKDLLLLLKAIQLQVEEDMLRSALRLAATKNPIHNKN